MNLELKELLDREARLLNSPDFIDSDPVKFPRMFSDLRDIEIAAVLVSAISWGNRKMILKDSEKMLAMMDWQPYNYVMEGAHEELPEHLNIHRTFFTDDLRHFLRGLRVVYSENASLDDFTKKIGANNDPTPAWKLAESLNRILKDANKGTENSRCFPLNTENSALKRLNMALRWLVRNDGIVDLGVWKSLKPSDLYIPLDVHVANVSRDLGLLKRKSNDKKAVLELTENLKTFNPDDPVLYDFALFGIGVTGRRADLSI